MKNISNINEVYTIYKMCPIMATCELCPYKNRRDIALAKGERCPLFDDVEEVLKAQSKVEKYFPLNELYQLTEGIERGRIIVCTTGDNFEQKITIKRA